MGDTTSVWVTIAVSVGGRTETFTAEANASGDGWRVADGILAGLRHDAGTWLHEQRYSEGSR